MKWNVNRWYEAKIHYIDLLNRCRTFIRSYESKDERQVVINDFLRRENEGIIQKVTAIDLYDFEIWERV